MRVLIALVALVTAPFLASVAQEPPGNSPCWTVEHGAARDVHSQGQGRHLAKGHTKHECAPPVGGGGDGGGTGGGGATTCLVGNGFANIVGMSWWDVNGNTWQDNPVTEPGQAGWTIELSCGGTVVATTQTGLLPLPAGPGDYAFTGLSDGSYLVCEVVPSGWHLTLPMTPRPCSGGFGYTVDVSGLVAPQTWLANDFGNTTP
ncbi:MAG: hypothetical protein DMD53_06025 [Gemmatimonadetes bacterium]|nr:MAG: hypothetical protein DMD53_06025 [Gemmatimonadota bacterium]